MTSVQFEWGDNFRVKPNELLYLLIEGTKIEDSYLTFMRNCILGGDNFRAFRVDLGGQNSKGDNFQLYPSDVLFVSQSTRIKINWKNTLLMFMKEKRGKVPKMWETNLASAQAVVKHLSLHFHCQCIKDIVLILK